MQKKFFHWHCYDRQMHCFPPTGPYSTAALAPCQKNRIYSRMLSSNVKKIKMKQACLFQRIISAAIYGLGRYVKFQSTLSRFVLFLLYSGFLFVNNGEQFEDSVLNLRSCSTKGYIGRGNKKCSMNPCLT